MIRLPLLGIAALVAIAALASCGPSVEERRRAFVSRCVPSGFKPAQCDVLWELKAASDAAKSSADAAFIVGVAGTAGRR